ncbi:type IV secretory system conjugative DNA transfer family protein [Williamsia sp. MIQD14]|uniref:type IV secretory system conjugative DNA transfer family protein n=1 Tax=Williamsia sp. MIQD14 TaxID=3425703 RepID=UPI003D9FB4E1
MSSTAGRTHEPTNGDPKLIFGGLGLVAVIVLGAWGALQLAGQQQVPGNPLAAVIEVGTGKLRWSTAATVWAVMFAVLVAGIASAVAMLVLRRQGRRTRVDDAVRHLGRGKDIYSITRKAVTQKAKDLGVVFPADHPWASPGVPIGGSLPSGPDLFGSFEDMHADVWGPRSGKSTSRVIPAIVEAPGAVLATENKRGNLDHTRGVREALGRKVWVFDPQAVAEEPASFYWNPLSYVVDEDTAQSLAEQFAAGDDGQAAKKDPYFDPEGQDLVANLCLASALAREPITTVYERLGDRARCHEAITILNDHRYPLIAQALAARLGLHPKQADGIFGTAIKMVHCLRSRKIQDWITTHPGDTRPQIDLEAFVRNGETLYCLSREGVGSTGPIIAAMTVAACEAGEKIATRSPGGRLPTPMLCALDEAANVVRWKRLPDLYSHYGSRGINIMTVLQNWSQGVRVWTKDGLQQLSGASNVFVYGGGVKEIEFLEFLSKLVGDYERRALNVSRSSGQRGGSVSESTVWQRILTVADLQAWPRGRLLILSAGNRPTIGRMVPWMEKPYASEIRASLAKYSPTPDDGAPAGKVLR